MRCCCSRSFAFSSFSPSVFFIPLSSFSSGPVPVCFGQTLRFDHRRRTTSFAVLSNFGQSVGDSSCFEPFVIFLCFSSRPAHPLYLSTRPSKNLTNIMSAIPNKLVLSNGQAQSLIVSEFRALPSERAPAERIGRSSFCLLPSPLLPSSPSSLGTHGILSCLLCGAGPDRANIRGRSSTRSWEHTSHR